MKVWLIKKFAECIDDIDLSDCRPGDVLDLPEAEAELLLAEGWAAVVDDDDNKRLLPTDDHLHRAS